jgi:hypothetical protein
VTRHHLRGLLLAATIAAASACGETIPTEPTEEVGDVEATFSSQLVPGGSATRAFNLATGGTLSITLSSTTPAGIVVGLGIGIPRADGTGCTLTMSVETAAGSTPQLSVAAGSGTYCAKVYDVGQLTTSAVPFTLVFSRP